MKNKGITEVFKQFILDEYKRYPGSITQFCLDYGITRKAFYKILAGDDVSGYNTNTIDHTLNLRGLTIIDLMERYGKE